MKRSVPELLIIAGIVTAMALVASGPYLLRSPSTASRDIVQVEATVLPSRVIIVDRDLTIQEVYSNTPKDVRPAVYLGSVNGVPESFDGTVRDQYAKLEPTLDFGRTGIVYAKANDPVGAFFRNIWKTILGWL